MRNKYPELLGDDEQEAEWRLFEYLTRGNPEAVTEDEAYEQAFDHLMEVQREQAYVPF
jgi:hypothetical protein